MYAKYFFLVLNIIDIVDYIFVYIVYICTFFININEYFVLSVHIEHC